MMNFYTVSLKTEIEFNDDITSFIEYVKFHQDKFQALMTKNAWESLMNTN